VQGIVLVVAASEVLPRPIAVAVVSTALALLVWSFGHDVVWLWRNARPRRSAATPMADPMADPMAAPMPDPMAIPMPDPAATPMARPQP
jgi:hypothetical protein